MKMLLFTVFSSLVASTWAQACSAPGAELVKNGNFEASSTNIAPWSLPDDDSNAPLKGPIVSGFKSKQAFGANTTVGAIQDNADYGRAISQTVALCTGGLYLLQFDRFQKGEQYYSMSVGSSVMVLLPNEEPAWSTYKIYLGSEEAVPNSTVITTSAGPLLQDASERIAFGLDNISLKRLAAYPSPAQNAPNLIKNTGPFSGSNIALNTTLPTTKGATYLFTFDYRVSLSNVAVGGINAYIVTQGPPDQGRAQINYGRGFTSGKSESRSVVIPFVARSSSVLLIFYGNTGCYYGGLPLNLPCAKSLTVSNFGLRLAAA